jgi:membrane-associated phospholipid phosphatase
MRRMPFLAVLLLCLRGGFLLAQVPVADPAPPPRDSRDVTPLEIPKLLLDDTLAILEAPFHWQGSDWLRLGAGMALVAGTGFADSSVRSAVARQHSSGMDEVTRIFEPFGQEDSFILLGGFYAFGAVFHDPEARSVAVDGLAASLIASGLITPTLKFAIGRSRPYEGLGPDHFAPFGGSASLPSGHTTQAFATATVIASHYPKWWVFTVAYGTAGLVGYARIYHDKHWTSDVVGGALIGSAVGWSVVRMNRAPRKTGRADARLTVTPLLGDRRYGLLMDLSLP